MLEFLLAPSLVFLRTLLGLLSVVWLLGFGFQGARPANRIGRSPVLQNVSCQKTCPKVSVKISRGQRDGGCGLEDEEFLQAFLS